MSILQQAVADLVIKATQAAEAAGKFAVEQLPDIAQQYVLYVGVTSVVKALLCVSIVILFCFAVKKQVLWVTSWKREAGAYYDSNERPFSYIVTGALALVGGVPLVGYLLHYVDQAILAFLAPKILLIQWAAELVK